MPSLLFTLKNMSRRFYPIPVTKNKCCCCDSDDSTPPPECIAPAISTDEGDVPDGNVGVYYTFTFGLSAGTGPITWSILSGTIPPGLSLDSGTGELSGIPTTQSNYTFEVGVSNPCGDASVSPEIAIGAEPIPLPSSPFTIWGEWVYDAEAENNGLPATFTQDDIILTLRDGDDGPPARIAQISDVQVSGHIDYDFPETAAPTFRVWLVPVGYFSAVQLPPGTPAVTNPTPSTVYQTGLMIGTQLCDVYVLANADPGPFSTAGGNQVRGIVA